MTNRHIRAGVSALNRTWAAMHLHWRALAAARLHRRLPAPAVMVARLQHGLPVPALRLRELMERPSTRRLVYGGAAVATFAFVACAGLWWRLNSGPLSLDMATPWLTSAVEERLGG